MDPSKLTWHNEGAVPVDLNKVEAYTGDGMLPAGNYRMIAVGLALDSFENGDKAAVFQAKILMGPDNTQSAKGRVYYQWFNLRDTASEGGKGVPAGWFVGLLERLVPGGYKAHPERCKMIGGGPRPDMRWICGKENRTIEGEVWPGGAVFDCALAYDTITDSEGKKVESRYPKMRNITLIEASMYYKANAETSEDEEETPKKKGNATKKKAAEAEAEDEPFGM